MGRESGQPVSVLIIIVLSCFEILICAVSGDPQVPCYFIFGDSLADSGNNNQLVTQWKANYPPYGIDFPKGVTGRFTDGRTSPDFIGEFLGFDQFIPPYTAATDEQISKGVNYASGGAGIRKETGRHMGDRISLDRQLLYHTITRLRLFSLQKNTTTLNECIYLVNIGSNDYINNYLMPDHYNTSHKYTADKYAEVLIKKLSRQLKRLYNLGGRKVAVFGLTKIGCTPLMVKKFGTDRKPCVDSINDAVNLFNNRFKPLVDKLNKDKSDARFTFINATNIEGDVWLRTGPCCELRGEWACLPNSYPCPLRIFSMFWDGLHPTQISNMVTAERSYKALLPMDVYPYDIQRLAQL